MDFRTFEESIECLKELSTPIECIKEDCNDEYINCKHCQRIDCRRLPSCDHSYINYGVFGNGVVNCINKAITTYFINKNNENFMPIVNTNIVTFTTDNKLGFKILSHKGLDIVHKMLMESMYKVMGDTKTKIYDLSFGKKIHKGNVSDLIIFPNIKKSLITITYLDNVSRSVKYIKLADFIANHPPLDDDLLTMFFTNVKATITPSHINVNKSTDYVCVKVVYKVVFEVFVDNRKIDDEVDGKLQYNCKKNLIRSRLIQYDLLGDNDEDQSI